MKRTYYVLKQKGIDRYVVNISTGYLSMDITDAVFYDSKELAEMQLKAFKNYWVSILASEPVVIKKITIIEED